MTIYSYTTTHRPPHPSAPSPVATLITRKRCANPQPLVRTQMDHDPGVVTKWEEHVLDFPELPVVGRQGVAHVAQRYGSCARCHLSERRTRICHLRGSADSTVAVIGPGPGRADDTRGVPFSGKEGKLQDGLLREVGLDPVRDLAWLTLTGCRPCDTRYASDRAPSLSEKLACAERTTMLLRAVRPRVVVCLGKEATSVFWDKPPPFNTWHTLRPKANPGDWIAVGVARDPGYLLRSVTTMYQEYFAARLFWLRLKSRMATLTHTAAWRFDLRYVAARPDFVAGI